MYTYNQITHIHILFSLWPSETYSENIRHTHAHTHTHTHASGSL